MCMPNVELTTIFNLKNLTEQTLTMQGISPTYGVFELSGHTGEFNEFFNITDFPFTLKANEQKKFYFKFKAFSITSFPARKNTARLRLGLFNPDSVSSPTDTNDLVGFRDFVVIARKTIHNIDMFENFINFDSVYVYPKDTIREKLIVQNSSENNQEVFKAEFERSFNAEITATIKSMPLKFSPYLQDGFQHIWDFAYYPRNMGLDTATLTISYKPDPLNYPDSVDERVTLIHAVGVQQDLGIIRADSAKDFDYNSLDFGDVAVGKSKEVKFVIRTIGNIPFGALSQEILQYDSDKPAEGFTIERKMADSSNLQPFMTDTMVIRFAPVRSDTIRARLVIKSDITNRHIIGYPDSVKNRTFVLNGVGRQAEIAQIPKEIDFGNIVVNETGDCPTRRDTLIPISNIGNLQLVAHSKVYPDNNNNPFKVEPVSITILGHQTKYIKVSFDSIIKKPSNYEAQLYIVSNSPKDKDTLVSVLKARGVYPDTMNIQIPQNISAKPGRRISIPILIDKKKASIARIFIDTLTYNESILYFYGTKKEGTAAEFADVSAVQDPDVGALYIDIRTLGSERFLSRDTLIILEFDTYLGDSKSTPLHFLHPKFGDGVCEQILSLNRSDGNFAIDSVCGLDQKIGAQYYNGVRFKMLAPNPASNQIRVVFELDEQYNTQISIFNSYGENVALLMNKKFKKGIHSETFELGKLPNGIYFIEIRAGIFNKVEHIIIAN